MDLSNLMKKLKAREIELRREMEITRAIINRPFQYERQGHKTKPEDVNVNHS